jgi:hypothetical protein
MNITLKKLMGAYETKYRVLKRHSDKNNFYFFIKFKLKVFIIRLLNKLNFLKLLSKRRTKRFIKSEKKLFNENLALIKSIKLPSVD